MSTQNGYRVMPIKIRRDEIDDEGKAIMKEIELISNKPFSYLVYAYLQQVSNSDTDTRTQYRKVYLDRISSREMSKKIRISRNKILSNIKYLEQQGFISKETYKDFYGQYKRLYVLDCRNYVKLDFDDKRILKLIKCIKETGLRLYLIYRYYNDLYEGCYLTMNQICNIMGMADSGSNRKTIATFNEVLSDIGLIKIEKSKKGKYKNKNFYRCI